MILYRFTHLGTRAYACIMHLVFLDDSAQTGRRRGMGKLLSIGAVMFPEASVAAYAEEIEKIRDDLAVPRATEMKWSPPPGHWLRTGGGSVVRAELYRRSLELAADLEVRTVVVVWDTGRRPLTTSLSHVRLLEFLYERVSVALEKAGELGILIADRPGGGVRDEETWLAQTVDLTDLGTIYGKPDRIILPIVTAPSHHLPQLQLADLVTSATTAMVANENQFARPLVPALMKIVHRNYRGSAAGTGIKLYPDDLLNLHHWAFGETTYEKVAMNTGWTLPSPRWEYSLDDGLF